MRNLMTEPNMQIQMPVRISRGDKSATAFEIRFRNEKIEVIDISPRSASEERQVPSAFQKRDLIPHTPSEATFRNSSRNFHNTYLGLDGVPQSSSVRNSKILMDDTSFNYGDSRKKPPDSLAVSQIPRPIKRQGSPSNTNQVAPSTASPPRSRIPKLKKIASAEVMPEKNEVYLGLNNAPKPNFVQPNVQPIVPPIVQSNVQPSGQPSTRKHSLLRQRVYSSPAAMVKDDMVMPTEPLPPLPDTPARIFLRTASQTPNHSSANHSPAAMVKDDLVMPTEPLPQLPDTPAKFFPSTASQSPNPSSANQPPLPTPAVSSSTKSYKSIDDELPPVIAKRMQERLEREREKEEALRKQHEDHMRRVEQRMRHKEEAKRNARLAAQSSSSVRDKIVSDFSERPIRSTPLEGELPSSLVTNVDKSPEFGESTEQFELQVKVVEPQDTEVERASQKSARRREQRMAAESEDKVKKNNFCCCVIS